MIYMIYVGLAFIVASIDNHPTKERPGVTDWSYFIGGVLMTALGLFVYLRRIFSDCE